MKKIIKKRIISSFSSLAYFYKYLKYRVLISILLSIMVGVLDGLGLSMFLPLLELVGNSSESSTEGIAKISFYLESFGINLTLGITLLIMVFFFTLKGVFSFYSLYYQVVIMNMFIRKQRLDVLDYLVNFKFKKFIKSDAGRIQNTLSLEVDRVAQGAAAYFQTIQQGILVAVYAAFAFMIDVQFALLVVLGGILTNFLYKIVYKYTKGESKLLTSNNSLYQGQVAQLILNFKYLKATSVIYRFKEIMVRTIFWIENNRKKIGVLNSILVGAREPILIGVIAFIIFAQVELLGGQLSGILISLVFFYRALTALTQMQTSWNSYLGLSGSMDNVQNFQNEIKEGVEDIQSDSHVNFDYEIRCVNGFFKYEHEYILHGINLNILKNSTVAFVGESGSGKTTLVNIICGLLEFTEGKLMLDEKELDKSSLVSYRKKIGYITQEPVIFNDTIFNNITLWADFSEENMIRFEEVCKQAHINEFIMNSENKENTILGNNGINLSGGQKQRISIARELFKHPEILIFDEATSALDIQTEKEIQRNIFELKGKYTVIMIAHRLATIKNADNIFYMSKGKIINCGNYDELLEKSPEFRLSVESQ